jgi:endonuclease YncB( thermonuclease family)
VDGDTIELANGEHVRIVGIDTPEVGECGYDAATRHMERLVEGKRVRLTVSDENRDYYGRLLRYVNVGRTDAGLRQIKAGLAVARYDSRDGYGFHPREHRYIAADNATRNKTCPRPKPARALQRHAGNCAPGYKPCVPPYPPDVDCADVDGPVYVTGSDPHGLDRDGDGVACET